MCYFFDNGFSGDRLVGAHRQRSFEEVYYRASEVRYRLFELDQKGDKVVIRGNNYVSIATGLNWYLKYYAGIHLSWNGMQAKLPAVLPPVTKKNGEKRPCLTVMI